MRRPWVAGALLVTGAAAILVLWFGFGGDRAPHVHAGEGSSVIAGVATGGAGAESTDRAPESSAQPVPDPPHVDHAAHAAPDSSVPATQHPVEASTPESAEAVDAPAADRRQVSLGEAAGGESAPSSTAAMPAGHMWIDADAAGVNEGTKQQAAGVALAPASVVDPSQVLPSNGLTNGCVAGYGRGTQCLPQTPPSHAGHGVGDMSIYWTCAEAHTLLPDGIVVDTPGTDPLGLDGNGDGTACGVGDR